jgi:peptide-methionine (R)-S-oxide reductase
MLGTFASISGLPFVNGNPSPIFADDDPKKLPFKKVVKTDAEWKRILTAEQYKVARRAGTEVPYSTPLNDIKDKGVFACVCCSLPVFSSETKFDSGTGWPSFYAPIAKINVGEKTDKSAAEVRTEVLCNRCDAHLGHVFDDGPKPTGLRYCINGVAMKFVKKHVKKK